MWPKCYGKVQSTHSTTQCQNQHDGHQCWCIIPWNFLGSVQWSRRPERRIQSQSGWPGRRQSWWVRPCGPRWGRQPDWPCKRRSVWARKTTKLPLRIILNADFEFVACPYNWSVLTKMNANRYFECFFMSHILRILLLSNKNWCIQVWKGFHLDVFSFLCNQ